MSKFWSCRCSMPNRTLFLAEDEYEDDLAEEVYELEGLEDLDDYEGDIKCL
jgi:hypothetical protein